MLRKLSFTVLIVSILLTCSTLISAQGALLTGKVELKKADGTLAPVAEATIQIYRTDVIVKFPSTTTDSSGNFTFAGLPFVGTYTLAVSGAGLTPLFSTGAKPGKEVNLVVQAGDGKPITDPEFRTYVEQIKAVNDKNAEIETRNAKMKASLDEGLAAFKAKNWDLAIEKFDQGIQVDPDFAGSVTVLSNNKAAALRNRGIEIYNQSIKNPAGRDSLRAKAADDFRNSIAASKRTLDLISTITDLNKVPKYNPGKYIALLNTVEIHRLLLATNLDASQPASAVAALDAYLLVEADPALKVKNQLSIADALRGAGIDPSAIPIYRRVLSVDAANLDATVGLGLCLLNEGEARARPELFQESINLLDRFVRLAPDTHPLRSDVQAAIQYLKEEKKLTPKPPRN